MSLDRDELAARLAAANLSNNGDDVVDPAKWAAYVVRLTDALLAALVPVAPASGAPEGAARLIYVDGRGITVADVTEPFNVGDEVLIRARVRAVEESDATPMKALLLKAGWCHVARPLPGAPPAAPSPAASPAAYVPKVGDVVGIDFGEEYGKTRVVTKVDGDDVSYVRLNTIGAVICRHAMKSSLLTYLRPATAAERVAAGLDAPAKPAVDREGLARALRVAYQNATLGGSMGPWEESSESARKGYLAEADAAIAFLKANGGVA